MNIIYIYTYIYIYIYIYFTQRARYRVQIYSANTRVNYWLHSCVSAVKHGRINGGKLTFFSQKKNSLYILYIYLCIDLTHLVSAWSWRGRPGSLCASRRDRAHTTEEEEKIWMRTFIKEQVGVRQYRDRSLRSR